MECIIKYEKSAWQSKVDYEFAVKKSDEPHHAKVRHDFVIIQIAGRGQLH